MPFLVTSFKAKTWMFHSFPSFHLWNSVQHDVGQFSGHSQVSEHLETLKQHGLSFVSAIVMVFNSQLSDFNSLYSLCSYLLLPLSPKNGLATLLSVPPVLNGSETLQHVPWQLLLLLPDLWISPKHLTPFMMLSTHCTHCKPPPPTNNSSNNDKDNMIIIIIVTTGTYNYMPKFYLQQKA